MSKETILITDLQELENLKFLLEEYQMHSLFSPEAFLNLGYKNVSSGAKDTYRLMSDLYKLRSKKDLPSLELSLNYLSIAFDTSEECQSERLKSLEKAQLVAIDRRAYNLNSFIVKTPLPDYTFLATVERLILRKRLGFLLGQYKYTSDIIQQRAIIEDIKALVKLGASHQKLSSIKHLLT